MKRVGYHFMFSPVSRYNRTSAAEPERPIFTADSFYAKARIFILLSVHSRCKNALKFCFFSSFYEITLGSNSTIPHLQSSIPLSSRLKNKYV